MRLRRMPAATKKAAPPLRCICLGGASAAGASATASVTFRGYASRAGAAKKSPEGRAHHWICHRHGVVLEVAIADQLLLVDHRLDPHTLRLRRRGPVHADGLRIARLQRARGLALADVRRLPVRS